MFSLIPLESDLASIGTPRRPRSVLAARLPAWRREASLSKVLSASFPSRGWLSHGQSPTKCRSCSASSISLKYSKLSFLARRERLRFASRELCELLDVRRATTNVTGPKCQPPLWVRRVGPPGLVARVAIVWNEIRRPPRRCQAPLPKFSFRQRCPAFS